MISSSKRVFQRFFQTLLICFCAHNFIACSKKPNTKAITPQTDYLTAKKHFDKKKYKPAAAFAWVFIKNNETTADNYVEAEFIFAKSLEKLKLYTVAVEYYVEIIRHGGSKEFIGESFTALFEIMEKLPYDAHLLEAELLASSEFAQFSDAIDTQIKFFQGKDDYIKEDTQWGDDKFNFLKQDSMAFFKVEYSKLIKDLPEEITQENIDQLQALLEKTPEQTRLKNTIRQTLARMYFEKQEYENSLKFYNSINSNILGWKDVFLEKAWNHFWLRDYQKTFGALHALNAPNFKDVSQPEKYLLYGMSLRNLCRYGDTREIIKSYRKKYGRTIDKIKNGDILSKINALKKASKHHPLLINVSSQQRLISIEKKKLVNIEEEKWKEFALFQHLSMIYNLKDKELIAETKFLQEDALKDVSSEIIHFNEQMNILEYETRLDEFKRGKFSDTQKPVQHAKPKVINADPHHWTFTGEYWLDELDLYIINVESACEV